MFINNLGQCEHALYLGCRECPICKIKEEESLRVKTTKADAEAEAEAEYLRLLDKIERL